MTFAATFDFARSAPANVRNRLGVMTTVAADVPRFDHDRAGKPIGLLVKAGADLGQRDRVKLKAPAVPNEAATVLHAIVVDGLLVRRAHYTMVPNITIDALLRLAGRHQAIGAVPGFLPLRGNVIRFRGAEWQGPTIVTIAPGVAIAAADAVPLLGG